MPLTALCLFLGDCHFAWAQRASDNALASAQDAFGNTVGNESVGLYTAREVRGFDPVRAGNVRLEGLYYDRQAPNPMEIFVNSMVSGSSVRVGISAQSYLFPAPTGIADVRLRIPGDKQVNSLVTTFGPYSKYGIEVGSQFTAIPERLSFNIGAGYVRDDMADASRPEVVQAAVVARWRPSDEIEILPFWGRRNTFGMSPRPNIYTAGPYLPPRIPRHVSFTQPWARNNNHDNNFGAIVNASLGDNWRLRSGLFRSLVVRKKQFNNLYQNTLPDGTTDNIIVEYPKQDFGSFSGEVRLSGVATTDAWRHTFHVAARGRIVERNFGGTDSKNIGKFMIGVLRVVPKPVFNLRELSHDRVRQGTGGVAYEGLWAGVGEMSVGLQKTSYRRTLVAPGVADSLTRDSPWLPNATVAVHATDKLTAFASYTRGLEESGEATNNATNRGEVLPAIRTSQMDAGLRYTIAPRLTAVASVFEVKKPYLGLNSTNLYTLIGDVRHRGVEVSLAGQIAEGLRIVAGSVFLRARVSGDLVDRGLVGAVPIGPIPRISNLDLEYGPPSWSGLSVDAQFENRSSRVASADNRATIPTRTLVNLGARYRFKILDASATLRAQARNIADTFGWDINAMQLAFAPEEKRRYSLNLAVDF